MSRLKGFAALFVSASLLTIVGLGAGCGTAASASDLSGTVAAPADLNTGQSSLMIIPSQATIRSGQASNDPADGWVLVTNGNLGEFVKFFAAGTYQVVVEAHGSPVDGVWPLMALLVDGVSVQMVTIDSAVFHDYSFQVALTSGVHTLEVAFLNDKSTAVQDRNIYLNFLLITAPSGVPTPVIAPALLIQAADASIKTATRSGPGYGGWVLWNEGTLGEFVRVASSGSYQVTVRAFGSSVGGVWPLMGLVVDGVSVQTASVDSGEFRDYRFPLDLTSGIHSIELSFQNDAYNAQEDRNLYLLWLAVTPLSDSVTPLKEGCLASVTSDLSVYAPGIIFSGNTYWGAFQYVPSSDGQIWLRLARAGQRTGVNCFFPLFFPQYITAVSDGYEMSIPQLLFGDVLYSVNLKYVPSSSSDVLFKVVSVKPD